MKRNSDRSLKSLNMKWLVSLAITDSLIILFCVAPGLFLGVSSMEVYIGRILTATLLPVIVLLIVNVLPHNVKSSLVYWKPLGVLPGCEAFTKYGPADSRIDMAALKKNVGALPLDPIEQNSKWYKLYKLVANEIEVVEAHKQFLMYRDMAVISLELFFLVAADMIIEHGGRTTLWIAAGVFTAQYLVAALSARWSGIRFVTNVLAIHSVQKITESK